MTQQRGTSLVRRFAFLAIVTILATGLLPASLLAQGVAPRELGEMPTTGGLRPGPAGELPGSVRAGVLPVAIRIESVDIDAAVEQQQIVDGVMLDPSGPFIVSWYQETGRLGEDNNMVMAGHLDYWDVGEAVFYNIGQVEPGDIIQVLGKDDQIYEFEIDWVKNFTVDDLTPEVIQSEIVGPTNVETITLITCGGPFDYQAGEYQERMVVRGTRIN
ncbi:MAG: class F sortase [Thermomicrobiales bacterium]|nr:class F sortase [Thermomicrobiales bacterium]